MIRRLLIANRGEIAVRIARTARREGIVTIGVYSEPDAAALHVDAVDIAVALGGATAAESYLRGDAIIAAALRTGADAIHPGYGFLSENADFARAVVDAGLIWVGPKPEQIELLGDKIAAKRAAVKAGVPTTPIYEVVDGAVPDGVPMPALVKAAAGGGGRGMRIVRSHDELTEAIESASREAVSAFGDGTVFIEPYIERGRHIEVQIMGDRFGKVLHFGERECSIQRRNQKVVEEAPSPGIDERTRAAVCEGAVALARHVGYENAGTVEFLVDAEPDADGNTTINFLEVNTRLQVEHPVTEAVTDTDLVRLQLEVASGRRLEHDQEDIGVRGHAIELRLVAEDPAADWLPSTGTVTAFDIDDEVRTDTGFRAGAEVSSNYDSLLAKIIASGDDRDEAIRSMERALRASEVAGVRTNLDMAIAMMSEPDFVAGRTPTAYLDEHPDVLTASGPTGDERLALLVGAALALDAAQRAANAVTAFAPSGWRNLRTIGQRQRWTDERGEATAIELFFDTSASPSAATTATALIAPWPEPGEDGALPDDQRSSVTVMIHARSHDRTVVEIDGLRSAIRHVVEGPLDQAVVRTRSAMGARVWSLVPRFVEHDADSGGGGPVCPLPGTVIAVHVEAGQVVADGDVLMVVEAMKMEHKITAATSATVSEVRFAVGDRVDQGDLLVALDTDS